MAIQATIGMQVAVNKPSGNRGMRHLMVGTVSGGEQLGCDELVFIRLQSCYAYHPAAPEGGRQLPLEQAYMAPVLVASPEDLIVLL